MKIKINILPDEQKEKREIDGKIGKIGRFGFFLSFILLFFLTVLFCAKLVLNINYRSVQTTANDYSGNHDGEMERTETLLNGVKASVQKVNNTSANTPRWSKVLKKLSDILPTGLRMSNIQVEGNHIKLQGFSKSRETLLNFLEKLKEEKYENIDSPISNLVAPTDFNFEIEMDVNSKYLNQF